MSPVNSFLLTNAKVANAYYNQMKLIPNKLRMKVSPFRWFCPIWSSWTDSSKHKISANKCKGNIMPIRLGKVVKSNNNRILNQLSCNIVLCFEPEDETSIFSIYFQSQAASLHITSSLQSTLLTIWGSICLTIGRHLRLESTVLWWNFLVFYRKSICYLFFSKIWSKI